MGHSRDAHTTRPVRWPRPVRYAFESIIIVFAQAYLAARSRAAGSPSKIVRLLAMIDDLEARNSLLQRELNAQRRRIDSMDAARRPCFLPDDRLEILKTIDYQGWNDRFAAKRLVMHRNTLRNWRQRYLGKRDPGTFFGAPPFNRISDSVRWLVHEMHAMGVRFGCRFHVAALIDGFSRRLIALKAYVRTPTSVMMLALVRRAIETNGAPRFLVCDHGCQFRRWFRERLESRFGVTPISGKVRCPTFNGKCERFFRTFRVWSRGLLFAWFGDRVRTNRWLQRRLDIYRDWYNEVRTHQALDGRTPNEVWNGVIRDEPRALTARDPAHEIDLSVSRFRGDHHLPVFEIAVRSTKAG